MVGAGGLTLTAWVLGDSMALRRAYDASLEDRAAGAEAERDAQARLAAAAERGRELQERRARAVDESAARLRRIERDLHDGAQVRLTALAMTLGEIKELLEAPAGGKDDGGRTRMLADSAHGNAKETLAELRDLARGIHPLVLDRGIGAALSALAETSAIPAELRVSIDARPSLAIEAIAYFRAAELLANVAKHSGATRAAVGVSDQNGGLLLTVADEGSARPFSFVGAGLPVCSSGCRRSTGSSASTARPAARPSSPSSCRGCMMPPQLRIVIAEDAAIMRYLLVDRRPR